MALSACAGTATPSPPETALRAGAQTGAFIEIENTRLHYLQTGPADAPVVLILHGATTNLNDMTMALDGHLDGLRAIYLDRPGLGLSERPGGTWSPEREAALISAFLDRMGVERAVVVSHSWGGAIALRLAMDHPDQVSGLVLAAPAVRAWVGEAAFYNRASRWPVIGPVITRLIVPALGPGQLESGAQSAFDPEPMPDNYVGRSALALLLRPNVWKANADDMARVNEHLAAQEDRYGEIAQPAIFLASDADTVLDTSRHSGAASQTLPNGELRLIEGAGHNLHHSRAALVAEAVRDVIGAAEG